MIELVNRIKHLMDEIYANSDGLDYDSFYELDQLIEELTKLIKENTNK